MYKLGIKVGPTVSQPVPNRSPSTYNVWGCPPMRASSKRNAPASTVHDNALLKKTKSPDKPKTKTIELSLEEARAVVNVACKEADDVLQSMKEPDKKPKTLKPSVRDEVTLLVRKCDPTLVLHYIKNNKKEFISGVFSSVFMSAIRKCLTSKYSSDACATLDVQESSIKQKIFGDENKTSLKMNSKPEGKPLEDKNEAKKNNDSLDSDCSTSSEDTGTS